jgi:hypothetical protein
LPNIKDDTNENCKIVDILEDTLSENGSFKLKIFNNNEFIIAMNRSRSVTELARFDKLKNAVDHIRKNIWYKKG